MPLENKVEIYNKIEVDLKQKETDLKTLLNDKITQIKEKINEDSQNLKADNDKSTDALFGKLDNIKNKQLGLIEEVNKTEIIDIKRTSLIKMDCKIEDLEKKWTK